MINQYWQHRTSGDIYAVQVEDGVIVSACGPLHHSEVTHSNIHPIWNFNNEPELIEALNTQRREYQVQETNQ